MATKSKKAPVDPFRDWRQPEPTKMVWRDYWNENVFGPKEPRPSKTSKGTGTRRKPQPKPKRTKGPAVVDLVVEDMLQRKAAGIETYGVPLQAHNGRDALVDLYEELLDAVFYLRQLIEERSK